MISAMNQSTVAIAGGGSSSYFHRKFSPALPSFSTPKSHKFPIFSISKPLHVSNFGSLQILPARVNDGRKEKALNTCKAYDSDGSDGEEDEKIQQLLKIINICGYFATWWTLNVQFNLYKKKLLNAVGFPWFSSASSMAAGSLIILMMFSANETVEPPTTDLDFWISLFPVALAHAIAKVAGSFTHMITSREHVFGVLSSTFNLAETIPMSVYFSLGPIIGGCVLSAFAELDFNMADFVRAMISNLAFVFRNILLKIGMIQKSISRMNYYAYLSLLSLLIVTHFTIAIEGPQLWEAGWKKAMYKTEPRFIGWVAIQTIFFHLYNQVSHMSLDEISPLTFSIQNTMKWIFFIVSIIIFFRMPIQRMNSIGATLAILGAFLHFQS